MRPFLFHQMFNYVARLHIEPPRCEMSGGISPLPYNVYLVEKIARQLAYPSAYNHRYWCIKRLCIDVITKGNKKKKKKGGFFKSIFQTCLYVVSVFPRAPSPLYIAIFFSINCKRHNIKSTIQSSESEIFTWFNAFHSLHSTQSW